jgi:hypothetical protein
MSQYATGIDKIEKCGDIIILRQRRLKLEVLSRQSATKLRLFILSTRHAGPQLC